jgi:hypothetical protein
MVSNDGFEVDVRDMSISTKQARRGWLAFINPTELIINIRYRPRAFAMGDGFQSEYPPLARFKLI